MNFYRAQDQARKQTFWLVLFYGIAVVLLLLITNLCVAVFLWFSDPGNYIDARQQVHGASWVEQLPQILMALGWKKLFIVSSLVCGGLGFAMWFKWLDLRQGGRVVAESLGGVPLQLNSDDISEQRLINIVEEMALAAGIPSVPVYVLDNEPGINAFAAGLRPEDAIIGVSRGALRSLSREQLQGVVAHEFSHILNGDMRLNIKIIVVLHGILMIGEAGRTLLHHSMRGSMYRSNRSSNGKANGLTAGLVLLGGALTLIGLLGTFFGALIRAAVSRQREFLADASAVQFTRNPEGISGALRVIGGAGSGSRIQHQNSHELGHLFFSSAYRSRWLATHPPLPERIKRVLPAWDGSFLDPNAQSLADAEIARERGQSRAHRPDFAVLAGSTLGLVPQSGLPFSEQAQATAEQASIGANVEESANNAPLFDTIFESMRQQVHEPLGAVCAVLALLFDKHDEAVRERQLVALKCQNWLKEETFSKSFGYVTQLKEDDYLPLIDLALPALKRLSSPQYKNFRALLSEVIHVDAKLDVLEWVVFEMVRQHCDRFFGLAKGIKPKYRSMKPLLPFYNAVLSRIVQHAYAQAAEQEKAYHHACNSAGTYTISMLSAEMITDALFVRSVHELAKAYPLVKPRVIKSLIKAAQSDGEVSIYERQVITAIATIMDCPLVGLDDF